jgi:hypothetical protein
MAPLAPGFDSTITVWPQASVSFWPTSRIIVSCPPPAGTVMMMRSGALG